MITKKKLLLHVLWGAIFGIIAGVAISYGNENGSIRELLLYSSPRKVGTPYVYLKPISETFQILLYFLVPGLCLGFSLGFADKSFKKLIYSSFGGLFGGAICYLVAQAVKSSTPKEAVLLISPVIYSLTIAAMLGISYQSAGKAIKGFIGGVVGWLIAIPIIFIPWLAMVLNAGWAHLGTDALVRFTVSNIVRYFLMLLSLTLGIFIGTEWKRKELCLEKK